MKDLVEIFIDLLHYIIFKPKTSWLCPKETPLQSSEQKDNQQIINNLNGTTDMMMSNSEAWKPEVIATQTRLEKNLENLQSRVKVLGMSIEIYLKS